MRRKLISHKAASITLALLMLSALLNPTTAKGQGQITVNGGGNALLTDTATDIDYAVQFGLSGVVFANGSANGNVNFVFPPTFSEVWGALPGVDRIHIVGRVTSGHVLEDGTVVLEGTLTERDYTQGLGVVFIEENVPFRIEIGGGQGSQTLLLQWCLLPIFPVAVAQSNLSINQ